MAVSDVSLQESPLKCKEQVPVFCRQTADSSSTKESKVKSNRNSSTIPNTIVADDNLIESCSSNKEKSKTEQGHTSADNKVLNIELLYLTSVEYDHNIACTDLTSSTLTKLLSEVKVDQSFNIKNNMLTSTVTGASEKENSLMYKRAEQVLAPCEQNVISPTSKANELNSVMTTSSIVNSIIGLNRNENFNLPQNVNDTVWNINVSELHKILEINESLPSSTTNNESNVLSVEKDSDHNVENINRHYDTTVTPASDDRINTVTCQDDSEHGKLDNIYCDSDAVDYESDIHSNETSDLKEKTPEILQNKTRKKAINCKRLENFDDFIGDDPFHYESDVFRNKTSELKDKYEVCQDESEFEYMDNMYIDNDLIDYETDVDSNEMSELKENAPEIPQHENKRKKTINCKRSENFDVFIDKEPIHYDSDVYSNEASDLKEKCQAKELKKAIYKSKRTIMEHKSLQKRDDKSDVDRSKASVLKKKYLKIPQYKSRKRVKMQHKRLEKAGKDREVRHNIKKMTTSIASKNKANMICQDDSNYKNSDSEYFRTETVYYELDDCRSKKSDFKKKDENEEKESELPQYKNREVGLNIENVATHCCVSVVSKDTINIICQNDSNHKNLDCEFIATEPVHYVYKSGTDKNETSCLKEKYSDLEMPQYKRKWDKIMEHECLDNTKEQNYSEHLLRSAKVQNKKLKVQDKATIYTMQKESNKLKKSECPIMEGTTDLKLENTEKETSEFVPIKKDKRKFKNNSKVDSKFENLKTAFKLKQKKMKKKEKTNNSINFSVTKPVKQSDEEKTKESCEKLDERKQTFKHLYGNRVRNRSTFLTELESDSLKGFKIPKKKEAEHPKEHVTMPLENFHSPKSPNINIESRYFSQKNKTKRRMKRTGWSSIHSPSSSHLPAKAKPKDNNANVLNNHVTDFHSTRDNTQYTKATISPPLLSMFPSNTSIPIIKYPLLNSPLYSRENSLLNKGISHSSNPFHPRDDNFNVLSAPSYGSDYIFPNRSIPLLSTPSTLFHSRDNSLPNRSTPPLNMNSTSFHPRDYSWRYRYSPAGNFISSELVPIHSHSQRSTNTLSSAQSNGPLMSQTDSMCSFSQNVSTRNTNLLSEFNHVFKERANFCTPVTTRDSFSASTSTTDVPLTCHNSLNSAAITSSFNIPIQNLPGSGLNSFFTTPINSSKNMSESSLKDLSVCLVPQHLKSIVGNGYINTPDVCLLILEWSVDWLMEQQKIYDPPAISTCFKKVKSVYGTLKDYYNTYFPLMLLDTWHRISSSWRDLNQHLPYNFNIISYSIRNTYVEVTCECLLNYNLNPKGVFPDAGSLLIVKFHTKSKDFNLLGYVTSVETRCFNPVADINFHDFKPPLDGNFKVLKVVKISFMAAYHTEDIDKNLPIRVHVLCNVKSALKQNDALLKLNKSSLYRNILNPVEDGILSFTLTARNSSKEEINKCVQDITEGILSPHPLPQLTIVKTTPESNRLNIIPLLIENMKNECNAKVLLCVRTVKALGEIAANICLRNSLKLVIINKSNDTALQFRKYLLDELVSFEKKLLKENITAEDLNFRNEAVIREKKQILNDSDVILSLIRNCHDEFMEKTFADSESINEMCCIVDEAHKCTEPETLIPLLHGISKLILIGDPDMPAKVVSKTAREFHYSRSFFRRTYDMT